MDGRHILPRSAPKGLKAELYEHYIWGDQTKEYENKSHQWSSRSPKSVRVFVAADSYVPISHIYKYTSKYLLYNTYFEVRQRRSTSEGFTYEYKLRIPRLYRRTVYPIIPVNCVQEQYSVYWAGAGTSPFPPLAPLAPTRYTAAALSDGISFVERFGRMAWLRNEVPYATTANQACCETINPGIQVSPAGQRSKSQSTFQFPLSKVQFV